MSKLNPGIAPAAGFVKCKIERKFRAAPAPAAGAFSLEQ